jgi:hypothetical protein
MSATTPRRGLVHWKASSQLQWSIACIVGQMARMSVSGVSVTVVPLAGIGRRTTPTRPPPSVNRAAVAPRTKR